MKHTICAISLLVLCVACKHQSYDERLHEQMAEYTRKECPKRIDPGTTRDSITYDYEPKRVYTQYFTVDSLLDNDTVYTAEAMRTYKEEVLRDIRTNLQFRKMRDLDVTFRSVYTSKKQPGKKRLDLCFGPEDYK